MKYLVTGGAGYIGSHVALALTEKMHEVVVLDSLVTGYMWAVPKGAELIVGDVRDEKLLDQIFSENKFDGVFHLAGLTQVEESTRKPLEYFSVNTTGSIRLVTAMKKHLVKKIIFSSTAALYAPHEDQNVSEDSRIAPQTPYGESKFFTERMIQDVAASDGEFQYVLLRYFNVAGAHPNGVIGQATPEATHLIKVACEVAAGKRSSFQVYGNDYKTKDGTCVRDFVHVCDLADAHLLALTHLDNGLKSDIFNIGYGQGYSVKEVLAAVEKVSGKKINVDYIGRRNGDISSVVANADKAKSILKFNPKMASLEKICDTAFRFEVKL